MKLFNFRRSRDRPATDRIGGNWLFSFGNSASGKIVNETTAMQTSAVYACVRIISEAIASLPLHTYVRTENGGKEQNFDHTLYTLLHDEPNDEMTSFVFRETLMAHLLLYGNAYAQIIRDGMGRPITLYPLLPNRITVGRNRDTGKIEYTYQTDNGQIVMPKESVLHIAGLGFDGLIGYSPIAMARDAIGMCIAAEEYGAKFFGNGANPGGVLQHPGVVKDPDRLRANWQAQFSGENAHKIAVLEEGLQFKQMSIPPEQAQFLETRRFQIDEIARIFRVPPHLLADLEKATFSNIEQQSLEFVKYCLHPWVVRWEQSLQKALLLPSEKGKILIRFNLDGLMRGDYKSRQEGYAIGRQNGWMSANDIRRLESMNPISEDEGGDLYLVNGNMLPLKNAGSFAKDNIDTSQENDKDGDDIDVSDLRKRSRM